MRIALVTRHLSVSHGGIERFSVNLAGTLLGAGHEVHVVAGSWEKEIDGIHYHRVSVPIKPAWLRLVLFSYRCRKLLSRLHLDIVYGLTQVFPQDVHRMGGGIYRHWIRLRFPNPMVRWFQCLIHPVHLANLYLEKQIYRPGNFVRLVANSWLCKNQISQYYDVSAEDVSVIYNGVDQTLFHARIRETFRGETRERLGITETRPVILFVSSNWKRKGLDTILHAMTRTDDYDLIVVGRGKIETYRNKASRLGLAQRVHFVGPSSEVQRYYGAADIFVLPTQYDPFANVCLEAMAGGLPVITTRSNGAGEIIEQAGGGRLVENWDDPAELALAIQKCMPESGCEDLRERALLAAGPLTLERNAAETLAVFESVRLEKECIKTALASGIAIFGGRRRDYLPAVKSLLSGKLPGEWEWVQSSTNSRVARQRGGGSPHTAYYKEFYKRSPFESLKALLRGSRCDRARTHGRLLRHKGFNSPAILCWGKRGDRQFMITEAIDAPGFYDFASKHWSSPLSSEGRARKRAIIRGLGKEVGRLHKEGIVHGDLRLNNVLVQTAGDKISFHFIDNERNRCYKHIPARLVEKNLVQLGMIGTLLVSLKDRIRFFQAYSEVYPRFSDPDKRNLMKRVHQKSMERLSNKAERSGRTDARHVNHEGCDGEWKCSPRPQGEPPCRGR